MASLDPVDPVSDVSIPVRRQSFFVVAASVSFFTFVQTTLDFTIIKMLPSVLRRVYRPTIMRTGM